MKNRQAHTEPKIAQQKGVVLITAILMLLAVAIFLPALIFVTNNESRWSVKQKKNTTAFHMAEQGLDRGIWKLQESDAIWTAASSGTAITGYDFDIVYVSSDSAGNVQGYYKIDFSSSSSGGVTIKSVGIDVSSSEVRSVEASYSKGGLNAGLISRGGLQYKPHLIVEWGPVIDFGANITNVVPTDNPRIITKGGLPSDSNPNTPNGHDYFSSWPQPATYNYNTYQSRLGNAPTVDFESYKTLAKNSRVPALKKASGAGAATSTPTGSGYYTEAVAMETSAGGTYTLNCSTCVIYVDAGSAGTTSVDFKGTDSQIIVRALIMTGDFEPKFLGGDSVANMTARIPDNAQTEYYTAAGAAYWTSMGWTNGGTYSVPNVRVKGYVYVGGNMSTSGAQDPAIIGTLDIGGTITINNTSVYYDSTISTGVLLLNATPTLQYWRESKMSW